ncbi:MAG: RNA 2'-phosphotransferase [Xenococcaceae cyanobacterium MO_234.B1]|nr:RNA 2'-phosphotransferase [Xenococcaceae cyanobacterium MO_234.B1]
MNFNSKGSPKNRESEPVNFVKVSKFLSFVLRHKPETIGLELDPQGWAEVDMLIDLAQRKGMHLTRSIVKQVVATNEKKRFSLNEDKSKIRANQGHSIKVDLALIPQKPLEYLFHGTATRFVESISLQGLRRRNRNQVHLSSDESTAIQVGQRHGKPVVLKIQAEKMYHAGFSFFLSDNGVWLTNHVPPQYIIFRE